MDFNESKVVDNREFDQWRDQGAWLAVLLLPLFLLTFRRGWLLLLPLLLLIESPPAQAIEWHELWKNADQRALEALDQGNPEQAAELFTDSEWQATAEYQAGNYPKAAKKFAPLNTARGFYNQGNALAKAGKLQPAIDAYQKALEQDPAMEDAAYNKRIVEDLLNQQQDQDQEQEQDQDQDQEQEQDQDQEQEQDQDQDKNKDSEKDSDQQQSPDKPSDQSDSEQDNNQQDPDENPPPQEPEQEEEENEQEESGAEPPPPEQDQDTPEPEQSQATESDGEDNAEDQATEQWLRQIPDDPAGLLRRKFEYESKQQDKKFKEDQPQW